MRRASRFLTTTTSDGRRVSVGTQVKSQLNCHWPIAFRVANVKWPRMGRIWKPEAEGLGHAHARMQPLVHCQG